jgi:SOS-response transcriptional repressor LexA
MTPRQSDLLTFLKSYIAEHDGVSPSFAEMSAHMGISSKSSIARLVDALVERGMIRREGGKYRKRDLVLCSIESEFERGRRYERELTAREADGFGSIGGRQ